MTVAHSAHPLLDLVTAKLRVATPYRDLIPRTDLIAAAGASPLVTVVADAGYGKTSFLYQLSRPAAWTIWYTLDERDNDPALFAQHLLAAANREAQAPASWAPYDVSDSSRLAERLVGQVLSQVDAAGVPTMLVLDDYHAAMDAPTIDRTVAGLLRDRPRNLRIAIASRRRLTIPISRLRAQGLVTAFGPEDLRFGLQDLRALFGPEALSGRELEQVLEITGGWPAAVQLLRDSLGHRPTGLIDFQARSGLPRPAEIDAFLAEEVLEGLEPDELNALRRISVVDEVDDGLCVVLTGQETGPAILNALARRYSFITVLIGGLDERGQDTLLYRVHPLVRDVLHEQLSIDEWRGLTTLAGEHLHAHGRAIEAARAFIRLRDNTRLAHLVREEGDRLLSQGRSRTLEEWFSHLPAGTLDRDAELLALHAQLQVALGHYAGAVAAFERAVDLLTRAGDNRLTVETLRRLAGLQERRGEHESAREALKRAEELVPADDPLLTISLRNQRATAWLYSGQPEEALALIEEVVRRCQDIGRRDREAVALQNLGYAHDLLGRFDAAHDAYTRALAIKRELALWDSAALTLNSLGVLAGKLGKWEQAQSILLDTITLCEEHDVPFTLSYALSNLGDLQRDRGAFEPALAAYERSLELKEAMGNPFAIAHTWNSLATLWRRQGDLARAREYSQRALGLRQEDAGAVERCLYREEGAQIALASGDRETACAELVSVAAEFRQLGARYHWARVTWSAGYAGWLDSGVAGPDVAEVLEAIDAGGYDALIESLVAETLDYALALWLENPDADRLAAQLVLGGDRLLPLLKDVIGRDQAERAGLAIDLLARMPGNEPVQLLVETAAHRSPRVAGAAQDELARMLRSPVPRLQIESFGGLRVRRRQRPIPERAWTRRRALEMFALLLIAGPQGRHRDELIAALWPEATPEAGVSQFHAHLKVLRAALEPESSHAGIRRYVVSEGGTYTLGFEHVESWDVAQFDTLIGQARAFDRQEALDRAMSAYSDALALYRGPLFAGLVSETEWLGRERERYERMAIEAAGHLAAAREREGDPTGAIDAYLRVIDLDSCREDAHRALMRLYAGLGRRDEALAQFRRCRATLRRELDVDPHPDTLALYRGLSDL